MEYGRHDLVGMYITDGRIQVAFGNNLDPVAHLNSMKNFKLNYDLPEREFTIISNVKEDIKETFNDIFKWIFTEAPNVRSIGIGCYGPFKSSELKINPRGREIKSYTQLSTVSGGRMLSGINLKDIVTNSLKRFGKEKIEFCIETDVAVDSLGYLYRQSQEPENADKNIEANTIGLIRADHGIGGTFIHTDETEAWHGVIHTEVGQINVQEWPYEKKDRSITGFYSRAANPDSVEGRASIPAIEGLYERPFDVLKKDPNHMVWDREAWYLAQLAWAFTCFVSPGNIVFCGSIMTVPQLLNKVRLMFAKIKKSHEISLPNYSAMHELDNYIDGSLLEENVSTGEITIEDPGPVGALCLAAILVNDKNIFKIK